MSTYDNELLRLQRILYLVFSGSMTLAFLLLILVRDTGIETRFATAKRRCHFIGLLCSILLVLRSIDPDASTLWAGGRIYFITDNITNLLLVACNVAAYQVYKGLFSNLDPTSMASSGSSSHRCIRVIIVFFVILIISAVNTLDALVIVSNVYWYRGIVMFVYVISFLLVIVLAELTGRNLRNFSSSLFPNTSANTSFYAGVMVAKVRLLMEDNAQREGKKVVSALQDILGPETSTSTSGSTNDYFSSHKTNNKKKEKK